jgi:hypothetical protein
MVAVAAAMGQDEGPRESAVEASNAAATARRGKAAQQEQSCERRKWRRRWQRANDRGSRSRGNHTAVTERTAHSVATPMVGRGTAEEEEG